MSNKYFWLLLLLLGTILLFSYFKSHPTYQKSLLKSSKQIIKPNYNNSSLPSFVASFKTHSQRQILQHVDLKRIDLTLIEDASIVDNYKVLAHHTDKVLVVPKSFG